MKKKWGRNRYDEILAEFEEAESEFDDYELDGAEEADEMPEAQEEDTCEIAEEVEPEFDDYELDDTEADDEMTEIQEDACETAEEVEPDYDDYELDAEKSDEDMDASEAAYETDEIVIREIPAPEEKRISESEEEWITLGTTGMLPNLDLDDEDEDDEEDEDTYEDTYEVEEELYLEESDEAFVVEPEHEEMDYDTYELDGDDDSYDDYELDGEESETELDADLDEDSIEDFSDEDEEDDEGYMLDDGEVVEDASSDGMARGMQIATALIGIVIICMGVVLGVSFYQKGQKAKEAELAANYAQIGTTMEGIDVIGKDGLLALQEAKTSESVAAKDSEAKETSKYEENNTVATIQVGMNMTSVQKDLKIKFVNKSTGKLIANVPFAVKVKAPDGTEVVWSDDDMDGIVYKKNITGGNYTITFVPFTDEKYEKYFLSAAGEKANVKEEIVYQKVDVSEEIKTEKEIDVSKEEQKPQEKPIEIESENKDTVAWVESTKTYVGDQYKEISRSEIDPPKTTSSMAYALLGRSVLPAAEIDQPTVAAEISSETAKETTETIAETVSEISTETAATSETEKTTEPEATTETEKTTEPEATTETEKTTESEATTETEKTTESEATTETEKTTEAETTTETTKPSEPEPQPEPTALKTKGGAEVFVKDGDSYRTAMSTDYQTDGMKFYIKEVGYKYTGWNTIDGYLYYFDANGNAVTGEQVIKGAVYKFDSEGRLNNGSGVMGIDVSSHNGSIDWNAVANAGVDYVIIRCGYRGYGSGVLVEDSRFRSNINGAINAGLKVGVYFFSQALDEIEAVEEASMVLNLISGYKLTYPIFLDVEYANSSHTGRADGLSKSERTAVCKAFCQTIVNSGYQAGVYANKSWLEGFVDASQLSSYKIWLAQYAKQPTYSGRYNMWQYSSTGAIAGISGNVDLNMSYLEY